MAAAINFTTILEQVRSKIVWPIFAGLAVIMFIYAGIMFLTSAGNPGNLTKAKDAVIWGVVGIIVAIAGYGVIGMVRGWMGA